MTFKVIHSGWYGTRNKSIAEVLVYPAYARDSVEDSQFVEGYIVGLCKHFWTENGHCCVYDNGDYEENEYDLIVYFGKTEPKRVADYLVPASKAVHHRMVESFERLLGTIDAWSCKQTHPIGQQPEGAVLVPGSERDETA